jgi:hypothetical protein
MWGRAPVILSTLRQPHPPCPCILGDGFAIRYYRLLVPRPCHLNLCEDSPSRCMPMVGQQLDRQAHTSLGGIYSNRRMAISGVYYTDLHFVLFFA